MNEKFDIFKELLEKSKKILLINHIKMDNDAFGSMISFYKILDKIGEKEIKLTNDSYPPKHFGFLPGTDLIDPNLDITEFNPDLIISFDAASKDRLGKKYENYKEIFDNTNFIVIDHHISNTGFGTLNIINPLASSTCELVYDILKYFKYDYLIDEDIATLLLSGIITDTNNFSNSNISKKTFLVASELMKLKARQQEIIINLYKKNSFGKIKLYGKILENLKKSQNNDIVWGLVPEEYFLETQTTYEDLDAFIDEFLVTISGVKVVFILYDMGENGVKGSFRSLDAKYSMAEFTKLFGGGGHPMAAGFLVKDKGIYDLESEVVLALKNFLSYVEKK